MQENRTAVSAYSGALLTGFAHFMARAAFDHDFAR